jgi:hypothetical protein
VKRYLIKQLFNGKPKAKDPVLKDLRSAIRQTATQQDAETALHLMRNGDVILTVDKDDVGEDMVQTLQELPGVTVSGISNPLEGYVQQRLQEKRPTK